MSGRVNIAIKLEQVNRMGAASMYALSFDGGIVDHPKICSLDLY